MTGSDKIFFDTAPLFICSKTIPSYAIVVRDFIVDQTLYFESSLFTSSLTYAEFFAKPKKDKNQALIEKFKKKIKEFHFTVADITAQIAEFSCDLRAKYKFLRTIDAVQLATAISFGCNKFVINGHQLSKVKEIEIILIDNLLKK